MTNKLVIAALFASVQSAATFLRDTAAVDSADNNWPLYADFAAAGTAATQAEADALSQLTVGPATQELGGYGCIRGGFPFIWAQTYDGTVANVDAASGTQTFFAHDDGTLNGAQGTNLQCCLDDTTCAWNYPTSVRPPHAVIWGEAYENGAVALADANMEWHLDFILIANWQDDTVCSSDQVNALAGTAVDVSGANIGALYKCTYKFEVAADAGAPSFKVKESTFVKFNLHWLEFENAQLTSSVAETSANPWNLGDVTGKWPMPIKKYMSAGSNDGSDSNVKLTDQPNDEDLQAYDLGTPGFLMTQTNAGSIWDGDAYAPVAYDSLKDITDSYNTRVAAYNSAVTAFNTLATAYNTAARAEAARKADATKAAFDAPIAIPTRPCPPTAVGAFDGPTVTLDNTAALTADQKSAGVVTWMDGDGAPSAAWSVKQGYLQAASSDTATAADTNAGHVYGILGQVSEWPAAWSLTASEGAFQWAAKTGAHEMIVSVLPYAAGMADDKSFTLTGLNVQFKEDWTIAQTAVTSTAVTALEAVGAKALAVSVAAAVAIQATLF